MELQGIPGRLSEAGRLRISFKREVDAGACGLRGRAGRLRDKH